MTAHVKTVLLTGGSGVIGQAILEKLRDTKVVCLVHRRPIEGPSVESIPADISLPQLGLGSGEYNDLARRVDYVIHSAAATGFGEAKSVTFETNVQGTRNIADFAGQARVPVCHISTAFAHLEDLDASHPSNAYERSKLESEEVMRLSGLSHMILRPSVVIGDSNDGRMARFQGFHMLCELMVRGILPVWVPTTPTAYMDFIPQDVVADVVALGVSRPDLTGEYWITSGARALQVDRAITLWEQHIPRLTGRAIKRPRYVAPDMIDRLIRPVFLPSLPARTQAMVNQALELLRFSVAAPLPTSLPELESKYGLNPAPDSETCLIRNAEFWARKRGFSQLGQSRDIDPHGGASYE